MIPLYSVAIVEADGSKTTKLRRVSRRTSKVFVDRFNRAAELLGMDCRARAKRKGKLT